MSDGGNNNECSPIDTANDSFLKQILVKMCLGRVIFICATIFSVGFPIWVFFVSTRRLGFITYAGSALAILALLTLNGFNWARIGMILISTLMAGRLFLTELHIVTNFGADNFSFLFVLLPLGYSVCAVLYSLPVVAEWQRETRRIASDRLLATHERDLQQAAADVAWERCYWCDTIAVDPREQYCRSCRRPAG